MTPIHKLSDRNIQNLYVKREDMIPFSFGGNKARKAKLFFEDIDKGDYTCVVTYGSSHSNHCRAVANMAAQRNMRCVIIGPEEVSDKTYNSKLMDILGAEIIIVPVEKVSTTIDNTMAELSSQGEKPYFIMGGGHGNIGTEAYVQCYDEILKYERENNITFDYIFFASGTGTTQAGLVCGQMINSTNKNIVGISIARKNPRGRNVVLDSIRDYLKANGYDFTEEQIQNNTVFLDDYTGDGYGVAASDIEKTIVESFIQNGMPLDSTYTGKAFCGMKKYVEENKLYDKNILFIHTGGTPLFFDDITRM